MIAAGTLRDQIQIVPETVTQQRNGQTLSTFNQADPNAATVWASVRPQSDAEQIRNGLTGNDYTYTIRIRYRDGVKDSSQIIYQGRTLDIYSVLPGGMANKEWLDIVAKERAA